MPAGECLKESGDAQRCGFISGLIGSGVQVVQEGHVLLLPQQSRGVEIKRHRDLATLRVISVNLQVAACQLQPQGRRAPFRGALDLHDLGKGQVTGSRIILSIHTAVKQADGKNALENQLAAHDLAFRHRAANLAVQQLRGAGPPRRKVHLLCKCKILFSNMCQKRDSLLLLPFFYAEPILSLQIGTEAQRRLLVARQTGHQLTVREYFPWIQHPRFQKFRPGIRFQKHTVSQHPIVAFNSEWHGKFQCTDAALSIRGVQHCDPYRTGDRCLAVPKFPAVDADLPIGCDNTRNIRTIVRHDDLCGLLLGQRYFPAALIMIQGRFFQLQFHKNPFLSRQFMSYPMNRRAGLCLNPEQFPQNAPQCLWRLPDHDIHMNTPFYRLQQAQPHAISRNATRNSSAPTGKIAAIRMPAPNATAQIPSILQPPSPPRNMRHASPLIQYIAQPLSRFKKRNRM